MKKSRIFVLVLMCALLSILLAGCFNFGHKAGEEGANLQVKIDIPEEYISHMQSQFVSYNIAIASISVTVSKDGTSFMQNATLSGNSATATFFNLQTGAWTIDVAAFDPNGYAIFSGTGRGTVSKEATLSSNIKLQLQPGTLYVKVAIPTGVVSGKVTLIDYMNPALNQVRTLDIWDGIGVAEFASMPSTTYPVVIELYDVMGTQTYCGQDVLDVLPGRSSSIYVAADTVGQGNLIIDVDWEQIPATPAGVVAVREVQNVKITWNPNSESNIAGYMVYRSSSFTGPKLALKNTLIKETTFIDLNVPVGVNYYYWVMAFNSDGRSSSLSEATSVTAGPVVITAPILFTSKWGGTESDFYIINTNGEAVCLADDNVNQNYGIWSPDKTKILWDTWMGSCSDLFVMNVDGTGLTNLTNSSPQSEYGTWSLDGTKILYSSIVNSVGDIYVMNADGTNKTQITFTPSIHELSGRYSPDGTLISYMRQDMTTLDYDLWVMNVDGTNPRNITNTPNIRELCHYWDPNGGRVLVTYNNDMFIVDVNTLWVQQLTYTPNLTESNPRWSPDGMKIAFECPRLGITGTEICVINSDGTGFRYLTNDISDDWCASWSPDGSALVFESYRYGDTSELVAVNVNDTGELRLTNNTWNERVPTWTNFQ